MKLVTLSSLFFVPLALCAAVPRQVNVEEVNQKSPLSNQEQQDLINTFLVRQGMAQVFQNAQLLTNQIIQEQTENMEMEDGPTNLSELVEKIFSEEALNKAQSTDNAEETDLSEDQITFTDGIDKDISIDVDSPDTPGVVIANFLRELMGPKTLSPSAFGDIFGPPKPANSTSSSSSSGGLFGDIFGGGSKTNATSGNTISGSTGSSSSGSTGGLGDALGGLASSLTSGLTGGSKSNNTSGGLGDLTNGITGGLSNIANGLTGSKGNNTNPLGDLLGGITGGLTGSKGNNTNPLGDLLSGITGGLTGKGNNTNPLGDLLGGITGGLAGKGNNTNPLGDLLGGITGGLTGHGNNTNPLGGLLGGLTGGLTNITGGLLGGITNPAGGLGGFLGGLANAAGDILNGVTGGIINPDLLNGGLAVLGKVFGGLFNGSLDIPSALGQIIDFVSKATGAENPLGKFISGIANFLSTHQDGLIANFIKFGTFIYAVVGTVVNVILNSIANIGDGLIKGILNIVFSFLGKLLGGGLFHRLQSVNASDIINYQNVFLDAVRSESPEAAMHVQAMFDAAHLMVQKILISDPNILRFLVEPTPENISSAVNVVSQAFADSY